MTAEISFLQFQILGSSAKDNHGAYQIMVYGATADGYSVSLAVNGFEPFFYVELPDSWTARDRVAYEQYLLAGLNPKEQGGVRMATEQHKSFWDFTNNRLFTFLKVQTRSKRMWTRLRDRCQDSDTCLPIPYRGQTLRVFEANSDPMLRFFHLRELKPAGWLYVHEDHWEETEDPNTTTVIQATAEAENICPASADVQLTAAPLKIMSWDIECTSSHGDFPLAKKTWRKPARELVQSGVIEWTAVEAAINAAVVGGAGLLSRVYVSQTREVALGLPAVAKAWTPIAAAIRAEADDAIDRVDALLTQHLPPPEGDPIIQIGCVLYVSGKPVRRKSTEVVNYISRATAGKLPIIGVGGISDPSSAAEKLDAGATLVQVYTGMIYRGPFFARDLALAVSDRQRSCRRGL
jgi:hypothetical protein